MIDLNISNYNGHYAYLNGQQTQDIKPFDLARALVTVGQDSWTNVFHLGLFRIGELICKAMAFTTVDNGNLVLQDRFFNLNQSEKATVSYYFGQGLTKLYAEEYLDVKWLLHVDSIPTIQLNNLGIAPSKVIVGRSGRNAERPDLIGIKQANQSHILEAKGSSTGYSSGVMQHAINQVSQVQSYNGVAPLTRTACYYDLSGSPIRGIIIDPENDEKGIEIKFSEESAINNYYSLFRENSRFFNIRFKIGEYEFMTTPVGVPNIFFGFDKRILELKPFELLEKGLYSNGNKFVAQESNRFTQISLGLDGIILINNKFKDEKLRSESGQI